MRNLYLLFVILFLLQIQTMAQHIIFTELPTHQQLPVGQIQCIFQDSEGYMWYGTEGGGLCRDDGYTIKVFRSDFNTPDLLESNHITCITEDSQRRIWFGTKRGVYILDKKDYQIVPLEDEEIKSWVISSIDAFSDGKVWVSSGSMLYRYDLLQKRVGTYPVEWQGASKTVMQMYEDDQQRIWLVQWRGIILRYDPVKDSFIPYPWPFSESPRCMLKDVSRPYLWIGTWGNGIVRFDPEAKDPEKMYLQQSVTTKIKSVLENRVASITQDSTKQRLWVTTMTDLCAYEISETDTLKLFRTDDVIPPGRKMLNHITTDQLGNVWVAGSYPHSFVISYQENEILRYAMPTIKNSLGFPPAPDVLAYENGYYWMWQKRQRLCLYDPATDKLLTSPNRRLLASFEKSKSRPGIFTAKSDTIVLSVQLIDDRLIEQEIVTLPLVEHERIRTLHEDNFGNLWIGTTFHVFRYNLKTGRLRKEWENTGIVNKIISLADGSIYLATETNGFLCLSPDGKKTCHGNTGENYSCLTSSPDQKIWIGTQQGSVYCYHPENDVFLPIMKEMGLNGDIIVAIEADREGHVWVLSNQKITIYNPEDQSFQVIRCSDPSVLFSGFLSLCNDTMGQMHVGGLGGVLKFPSYKQSSGISLKLSITLTNIKVNNIKRNVGTIGKIQLQPHEQNIELFFSTFDMLNADKIRYAFRHKGKSAYWNQLPEGQNSIYLTELSKGNYELEVKATDKNGAWSENTLTISIQRLPAWYETWWAYVFYILLFGVIVFYLINKYIAYQKQQQQIQMEEQVAQMKYRFFTNISHELRTPLTLIITPLETLMKNALDANVRKQLNSISKNAQNLLILVNQLLDFRKIEMGGEKLLLTKGDMNGLIHSVYENFRLTAEEKGLTFNYHNELSSLLMYFDADKMRKIINNLLSNAIKFTDEKGEIIMSLRVETQENRKYMVVSVEDNGRGIPEHELSHIFERFHQVKTSDKTDTGSGIGLHLVKEYTAMHQGKVTVESTLNRGTCFSVFIPMDLLPDVKTIELSGKNIIEEPVSDFQKKILIVEDNTDFRKYLKDELSRFYTVYEAEDGEVGERETLEKEPDVIITDLAMPKMNGIELCRRIKNNLKISHIPVILLTANTTPEYEVQGYKEGADAYISKPFHWDVLLSRIENLMEQKQQRQQYFKKDVDINPSSVTISSVDEQLLEKALKLIEKNMDNADYSIEKLSDDIAMSRVNLYRKIRSITGLSPIEFVNSIRLKRAAQLLAQGNMTVVEVAYSVGFNTPSYFTKSFKKMFGVLPTEYNKK